MQAYCRQSLTLLHTLLGCQLEMELDTVTQIFARNTTISRKQAINSGAGRFKISQKNS